MIKDKGKGREGRIKARKEIRYKEDDRESQGYEGKGRKCLKKNRREGKEHEGMDAKERRRKELKERAGQQRK